MFTVILRARDESNLPASLRSLLRETIFSEEETFWFSEPIFFMRK